MTTVSYPERARRAAERHEIHAATCRYRRSGLVCSTCYDLAERAERAILRAAAVRLDEVA